MIVCWIHQPSVDGAELGIGQLDEPGRVGRQLSPLGLAEVPPILLVLPRADDRLPGHRSLLSPHRALVPSGPHRTPALTDPEPPRVARDLCLLDPCRPPAREEAIRAGSVPRRPRRTPDARR